MFAIRGIISDCKGIRISRAISSSEAECGTSGTGCFSAAASYIKLSALLLLISAAAIMLSSCNPVLALNPRYSYTSFSLDLGDTIPYTIEEYVDLDSMSQEDAEFVKSNTEILYDGKPADEKFPAEPGDHSVTIMYCGHQYRSYQIEITDKEPPVIKVVKNIYTFVGIPPENVDPESMFSASDNSGKCEIKISKTEVDYTKAGKYPVTAVASDASGNSSKATAYVIVQKPEYGAVGTYVFVSIEKQHLTYFVDGKVVMDCPVVTGNAGNHNTPKGTFHLIYKSRNLTLKGTNDDGSKYSSFVNYWMAFLGSSYGLHDASWRSTFGGKIYQGNGSHGCVNMPIPSAAELFSMLEPGTPILIY